MDFWHLFTKLADTNLTVPAAAIIALWLLGSGAWRACINWCLLFGIGLFLVAATKVAYAGWGIGIASVDFKGFSGHAMRAAAIMPALMYLLFQKQKREMQSAGIWFGVAFAVGIGISRLVLGVHSVSEVVTGLPLGFAISFLFIHFCRKQAIITSHRGLLLVAILLLLPSLAMKPAPTESWIARVAIALAGADQAPEIRQRMHDL